MIHQGTRRKTKKYAVFVSLRVASWIRYRCRIGGQAMLQGERVVLRAVEREDLKRLHELARNVDLVLLGDGEWDPQPLAGREKRYDNRVADEDKAWFVIEGAGTVLGDINFHHRDRRSGVSAFGIGISDR